MQDQKTAACTLYPGVIPIMAYMGGAYMGGGGAPLERPGTIFRLRRIKKGRDFISWSIWRGRGIFSFVWNKGQEGLTDAFHGFEKVEKTFWLCDLFIFFLRQSILKVKGCKVLNFLGVWKGYHLSMEGIRSKGVPFLSNIVGPSQSPTPLPTPTPVPKGGCMKSTCFPFSYIEHVHLEAKSCDPKNNDYLAIFGWIWHFRSQMCDVTILIKILK